MASFGSITDDLVALFEKHDAWPKISLWTYVSGLESFTLELNFYSVFHGVLDRGEVLLADILALENLVVTSDNGDKQDREFRRIECTIETIKLDISVQKEVTCTPVKVGTVKQKRTVSIETREVEVDVPVIEWRCKDPILQGVGDGDW